MKQRKYKNAIANSLFLSVAIKLHLRTPNDQGRGSYREWAMRTSNWIGPVDRTDAVRQSSALDALNVAMQVRR